MSKSLTTKGGNDCIMTPSELGKRIIEYYKPTGRILEPCKGDGKGFYQHLIGADWCEIQEGKDFFSCNEKYDWIITNPPYSTLTKFLSHAMDLADNIVFLILLPNVFQTAKIKLAKNKGFGLKEVIFVENPPKPWPRFGFQLGTAHYQRGYDGSINKLDWTE